MAVAKAVCLIIKSWIIKPLKSYRVNPLTCMQQQTLPGNNTTQFTPGMNVQAKKKTGPAGK